MQATGIFVQIAQDFRTVKELLSPKQVALAIGVSEASLKRWCDKGLLAVTKTAGGHRRIALAGVVQFLRETGRLPLRPEVLGLPAATGQGTAAIGRAVAQTVEALISGDEERCRRLLFNLYLGGHPVLDICDKVLAAAFHEIGHRWEDGRIAIYRERRACEIARQVLYELRSVLPPIAGSAPLAIGGTASADPYQLPTTMVEVVLRECGWHAQSYGVGIPLANLEAAIREVKPRLFWLSVSSIDALPDFLADYARLQATATAAEVPLVVGGRALTKSVRRQMRYSAFCDHLGHLVPFAATLVTPRAGTLPGPEDPHEPPTSEGGD